MLSKLGSAIAALAFLALMAWALSMHVRGWVAGKLWDGKSTLTCAGNMIMKLERKQAHLTSGTAIQAAGNCELEIIDCEIEAPIVLSAAGNAKVQISGGKLTGAIQRGGNATVTGMPDLDAKQAKLELSKRFGAGACDGLLECYAKHDAYGQISGRVTMRIGSDGVAHVASYDRGTAPAEVRKCIVEAAQKKRIANFDGKPGKLMCEYAGIYMSGSQMLTTDGQFTRD